MPPLVSDLSGLNRIITLLNNACEYTPPSEQITGTADAQRSIIQLKVSNSGVEIPDVQLKRIFDNFYHIHNSDFSHQSGTRLGLVLVKN